MVTPVELCLSFNHVRLGGSCYSPTTRIPVNLDIPNNKKDWKCLETIMKSATCLRLEAEGLLTTQNQKMTNEALWLGKIIYLTWTSPIIWAIFARATDRLDCAITAIILLSSCSAFAWLAGTRFFAVVIAILTVIQLIYQFGKSGGAQEQARRYQQLILNASH